MTESNLTQRDFSLVINQWSFVIFLQHAKHGLRATLRSEALAIACFFGPAYEKAKHQKAQASVFNRYVSTASPSPSLRLRPSPREGDIALH
jgi:hypothetical protein